MSDSNGHKNGKNPAAIPATMPGGNGGTLRRGGTNPGAGRPPSALRAMMRESLASRIHIAQEIADNVKSSDNDRLKALEFLARYGMGTTVTETDTEGRDKPGRLTADDRKARLREILAEVKN